MKLVVSEPRAEMLNVGEGHPRCSVLCAGLTLPGRAVSCSVALRLRSVKQSGTP